jgi:serine/threonine-protein kinase
MKKEEVNRAEPRGQEESLVFEPGIEADAIRQQLQQILTSPLFAQSPRISRFLRFTVQTTLEGRSSELKEYVIGITVFDRKESYDPRLDPIVRVEAVRLREKIKRYYETIGQNDLVRIELPKRSYVPVFRRVDPAEVAAVVVDEIRTPAAPEPLPKRRMWIPAVVAIILVAAAGGIFWAGIRSAQSNAAAAGNSPTVQDPARILVLPFTDSGSQGDEEYFSAGLTEELINALTRIEGLRIVPTYAFRHNREPQDIRKISRELSAGTVIGGAVHKANSRVRVTVQMSDTSEGHAVWSESFERPANDLLTLHEEISRSVTEALRKRVQIASGAPPAGSRTKNAEAYTLYLKGRYHWNRRNETSIRRAIGYFEAALRQDPEYALAYSGLADCYSLLGHIGNSPPGDVMPKAKAAALKALELDDTLPEAYSSLGYVELFYEWNWESAERHFQRAIRLNPRYTPAYLWYSSLLMSDGRREEAISYRLRAEQIDPLSPTVARFVADSYYRMGDYDKTIRKCQEALELDPNFGSVYIFMGRAYIREGKYAEGVAAFQRNAELSGPSYQTTAMIAHGYAAWGKREQALAMLKDLEARARREYIGPFYIALIYAGLDDRSQTLSWLRKAFAEHSVWVASLPVDPNFDSIRKEPEFAALLRNFSRSPGNRAANR